MLLAQYSGQIRVLQLCTLEGSALVLLRNPRSPGATAPLLGSACPAESGSEGWPTGDSWQRWDRRSSECMKLASVAVGSLCPWKRPLRKKVEPRKGGDRHQGPALLRN